MLIILLLFSSTIGLLELFCSVWCGLLLDFTSTSAYAFISLVERARTILLLLSDNFFLFLYLLLELLFLLGAYKGGTLGASRFWRELYALSLFLVNHLLCIALALGRTEKERTNVIVTPNER